MEKTLVTKMLKTGDPKRDSYGLLDHSEGSVNAELRENIGERFPRGKLSVYLKEKDLWSPSGFRNDGTRVSHHIKKNKSVLGERVSTKTKALHSWCKLQKQR